MAKANLSNTELDKIFNMHPIPRITKGKGCDGGSFTPVLSTVNTNNDNNEYNVKRDESKKAITKSKDVIIERDQKVNGAMAFGSGSGKKKESLKKETGTTNKIKWSDFVKEIRNVSPELKLKDAMKVGSEMKKKGLYKMDDVNQQNVAMIYNEM